MPSFLDVDTKDAKELEAVPGDSEYKVRIVGFIEKEVEGEMSQIWNTASGKPCFMPIFEIPSKPLAKEFNTYMALPHDSMTEKDVNNALVKLDQFKKCFGVPEGKVDMLSLIGKEGWVILGLKHDDDYGDQNYIKKFILPKS